jgi:CheY-like chemotaxis protein
MNEKQLKAILSISDSGQHLLDLINDILDLSKIEAGKLEMHFTPCSASEVCQASLQLVKGLANQKGQNIAYSINPATITINADLRRLKQMLINLLSNAIKFTPEGGKLGLEVKAIEDERMVVFTIWDKGIGIKPEDMSRLFKPFVQVDSSLARQYSGTGLGLSLVQRMAELHGGSVKVESIPGEGSRFSILLPYSHEVIQPQSDLVSGTPTTYSKVIETPTTAPLVMIADDNKLILETISEFLEAKGFRVVVSNNGFELLERAAEFHPDIMLVDIQMPGMDGMETIRRLRTHDDPLLAATPIIAVTALAMPGDREKCIKAGANEYISKPVVMSNLVIRITDLLEGRK